MSVLYSSLAGLRLGAVLLALLALAGCAGVKVSSIDSQDYLAQRRGDVLTTGELSTATLAALQVVGSNEKQCNADLHLCRGQVANNRGLGHEQKLSSLSELWLKEARERQLAEARINAYLESARHAYAYLFFTDRTPGKRALEDRQTQIRDYYNFSVEQALTRLFHMHRGVFPDLEHRQYFSLHSSGWQLSGTLRNMRLAGGKGLPSELLPAASLSFAGLRNQYRRDGIGAELVAVSARRVVSRHSTGAWSETPFPAITSIARFPGETLEQVLATREVELLGYDPYRQSSVEMAGVQVPLAGNFTSGYGLWLARSGFARQSLLTLVGRGEVLESPHLFLLQPYDPDRRILIMLHGLASSPEAWINVANEVLGDETLRNNYQIWQIYYPTNLPIAMNNRDIRKVIEQTLQHFDPDGQALASQDMVLLGHSMGGVISRLLVTSTGDRIWQSMDGRLPRDTARRRKAREKLAPYLEFSALPQVSRAIFVAAPHAGTEFAENRLSRWVAGLVKLPVSVLKRVTEVTQILVDPGSAAPVDLTRGLNSIDNLSNRDPFIRVTRSLPIADGVAYHSIIGNDTPDLPLRDSHDGVVPYASAHLPEAESELVVPSWHSVQETPEAIVEIRRILHLHLAGLASKANE